MLTIVDKQVCDALRKMQLKCRETKSLDWSELQGMVFQLKTPTPVVRIDLNSSETGSSNNQLEELEFKAGVRSKGERDQLVVAEMELLNLVKVTQTNELFDTLTVATDLVKDEERFNSLTQQIAGSNFLRIPHRFDPKGSKLCSELPIWLHGQSNHSMPKWILYFFERAIFVHYTSMVKNELPESMKNLWLDPGPHLFQFRTDILPYWTEFSP